MIKEMMNVEACFRLIKSNNLANQCSLSLYRGSSFKQYDISEVRFKSCSIEWVTKLLKFIPSGMARLTNNKGIVVAQKILKSDIFRLDKGDQTRFTYTLTFNPRLLEFETLPKGITVNGSHVDY